MKISELKGVGEKTEKLFERVGVSNTDDLLNYYPRTYDVFGEPVLIKDIDNEGIYTIWATVVTRCELISKGRFKILTVFVSDDNGQKIKLTWFNMPFLRNELKQGGKYLFRGKVAFKSSLVFMEQPNIYSYEKYMSLKSSMQPVYRLTEGLTNNLVTKLIRQCFEIGIKQKEYLPEDILSECKIIDRNEALYKLHFPGNFDELASARKRIVFDEFFLFTLSMRSIKNANIINNNNHIIHKSKDSETIINNLGYSLTNAQLKTLEEINSDMESTKTMNRLIQGDVGSGKTIIALLAMVDVVNAGFQAALMAPTEVLAVQHYENFTELFNKCGINIRCTLLTGSMSVKDKKQAHTEISSHLTDIVIGTHAVITDAVEFDDLALVITDEQHRFGVKQREALHKKGNNPHVIVMSATPIPRSLAIILYGDLDISIIDEKPANRLPIKNCVVDDHYHKKACKFIMDEIEKGHQAYIICAMASENDESELKNVIEYSESLKKEFPESVHIEYLHGKMKTSEKNEIMNRFASGKTNILVSTTVVEVGINVPNATVMMIENAERFGLAGLHQLRGRVGRGKDQSYCIFVSNSKNESTKERLMILKNSNDGFYIAEQDLKLRGPGDILGTRQSGDFNFNLGDIYTDASVLKLASDEADKIIKSDPDITDIKYTELRKILKQYMDSKLERINL